MKKRTIIFSLLAFLIIMVLYPALLFYSAGTTNWPMAWIYTICLITSSVGSRVIVYFMNPDTLLERAKYTEHEDVMDWDRRLVMILGMIGPIVMVIVAGLDKRFDWSDSFGEIGQWVAAFGVMVGYGFSVWAMIENKFFSAVVRIQAERGHYVVKTGPYRIMRHPSYFGVILASLVFPIMMNSIWTFIPVVLSIVPIIIRTKMEDDYLQKELEGYKEFTQQTRYRLFPGIW